MRGGIVTPNSTPVATPLCEAIELQLFGKNGKYEIYVDLKKQVNVQEKPRGEDHELLLNQQKQVTQLTRQLQH